MLDLSLFYWLLAAFLLYAGWRNARERRWLHAGFWLVLALAEATGGTSQLFARPLRMPWFRPSVLRQDLRVAD